MLPESLDINNYIVDGFVKVCDVALDPEDDQFWIYTNINEEVMFDPHTSWLYNIVSDIEIVKHGESGNPLGIKTKSGQPRSSTECRLGRYRRQCGKNDTDQNIREALYQEVKDGKVTIWALKCQVITIPILICGNIDKTVFATHKDLEKKTLKYIKETAGRLPRLNKGHI
jgi:hypothetical protein